MAVPDTKLRNAKPKDKRYTIPVGENVHLEIMPTGLKSWRMRYLKPEDKKPAIHTIGRYPEIGQVEARAEGRTLKALIRQGINPKNSQSKRRSGKGAA